MRHPWLAIILVLVTGVAHGGEVAITMDDPSPGSKDARILQALGEAKVKAALFVCGMRVDSDDGKALVKRWSDAGHLIANHSYSHLSFNSKKMSASAYAADFAKAEPLIAGLPGFRKLFRHPFLKEGDTAEKRDAMRKILADKGYKVGHVTIDASDWYVSSRMEKRLAQDPHADLSPYRDFYVAHILDRTKYYDDLARKVLGRSPKHTLLIHHNELNARFLGDLVAALRKNAWSVIDAAAAFEDPVFAEAPATAPAGESLIWALAKATGRYDAELRYPGEDGDYEKAGMDRAGL